MAETAARWIQRAGQRAGQEGVLMHLLWDSVFRGWNRLLQGGTTAAQHISQHSEAPKPPFRSLPVGSVRVCVC